MDAWDVYDKHSNRPQSGEATMQQYAFQWRRFLDWMRKNNSDVQAVKAVTTQAARNYHADLLKAGLSPATVNKHIGLLRLVFSVINTKPTTDGAEEVLPNPFDNIKPKKHKVKSRRELTTEELRRIIDMASGEIKLLFAIGVYTGMRLGDCATLKWDEVEFDRNRICRIPNKTAANEKPVKIPLFATLKNMLQDAAQSKKGIYVLPETAILYHSRPNTITSRIQRLFWNAGIDCHAPGTGSQIVRGDNGEPLRTEGGNVALEPTGTRGVVQCGFHSLRHTFVSLCSEANTPMSVVQSIVGHSNPAMTRHYSHTSELEAAKAVAALPDITTAAPALPAREPLPAWARELLETQTVKNWKKIRSAILAADKKDARVPKQSQS